MDGSGRLRWFGVLCALAYVALSWSLRFDMRFGDQMASLVYPLDTFSMYAAPPGELVSHVLLRDARGTAHRVGSFRSFACVEPLSRQSARCADHPGFTYLYDDTVAFIDSHRGAGKIPMELIYRTWRLRPGDTPLRDSDCVIARCEVAR